MAGGLVALLDDIAALTKLAAASLDDVAGAAGRAGTKAAGVVIDDTAVTPHYVVGLTPDRELPIIAKIAVGSLRNKLLFILPVALALSAFAPWAITPLLMLGGAYLCFEASEKIIEAFSGGHHAEEAMAEIQDPAALEARQVSGAVRTDFILSAEIMVIALKEVIEEPLVRRGIVLVVVGLLITAVVYGAVAMIVKMDDVGLRLVQRDSPSQQRVGRGLVAAMPKLLATLSVVGTAAMLWVGGHILLVGSDELGWHGPYEFVHHLEEPVREISPGGGVFGWLVNTGASAVVGLVVGGLIVAVVNVVKKSRSGSAAAAH